MKATTRGGSKEVAFLVIFLLFLSSELLLFSNHKNGIGEEQEKDLRFILDGCSGYVDKLSRASLHFVCNETVTEEIFASSYAKYSKGRLGTKLIERNEYVYDYQVIRKDNHLYEKRILLKENGQEKHVDNAQMEATVFLQKRIVFGPLGLFGKDWQNFHEYKILKDRKFRGEELYVVEVKPKSGFALGQLYGKVWICKSDFSVIKIEWNQHSIDNFEAIEEKARELASSPILSLVSEYAFTKNGIRFPSKYTVNESYLSGEGRKFTVSKVKVEYDDYRFFTVEVEIK